MAVQARKVNLKYFTPGLLFLFLWGCEPGEQKPVPEAERQPRQFQHAGVDWEDPYAYLADLNDPAARVYLEAEKAYFADTTKPWRSVIASLAHELNLDLPVARNRPAVVLGDYELHYRIARGSQYPVYSRRHRSTGHSETVLDLNERARGSDYYQLGSFVTSPDDRSVAFTEDLTGSGQFTLCVRDIATGKTGRLAERTSASVAWHGNEVVYVADATVKAVSPDGAVRDLYREFDPAFAVSVQPGRPGEFTRIIAESHTTTDVRLIDSGGAVLAVTPRVAGHRYRLRASRDRMTILSNLQRADFSMAYARLGDDVRDWRFVDTGVDVRIVDFEPDEHRLLLHIREGLLHGIAVVDGHGAPLRRLMMAGIGEQLAFHTLTSEGRLRYWRRSLREPDSYWELDPVSRTTRQLFQVPLPTDYDPEEMRVEQKWIAVRDGQSIPVTLVYRRGGNLSGRPILLTAYGAYGLEQDLRFDSGNLPLLRRQFVLAYVHVRGGGDLGSRWHETGSGLNKMNTFYDLVDVTRALLQQGYGAKNQVVGRFASAGGAIGGYLVNEEADLFSLITVRSPFVDIVTALLDDAAPLTASDRLEWGHPDDAGTLEYLVRYSPYHRVRAGDHPDLLIRAGEQDGKVGLHESLKWLARLREYDHGDALMLIDIQGNSGHLGASDQYLRRRQSAMELAFILNRLGIGI